MPAIRPLIGAITIGLGRVQLNNCLLLRLAACCELHDHQLHALGAAFYRGNGHPDLSVVFAISHKRVASVLAKSSQWLRVEGSGRCSMLAGRASLDLFKDHDLHVAALVRVGPTAWQSIHLPTRIVAPLFRIIRKPRWFRPPN